jgi:hypothetical protein
MNDIPNSAMRTSRFTISRANKGFLSLAQRISILIRFRTRRALRPSKLPTETKAKTFLISVGVGLAVAADHELLWPHQQQSRNAPSRPTKQSGQGSTPKNAPEASYAVPFCFLSQFQLQTIALTTFCLLSVLPDRAIESNSSFLLSPSMRSGGVRNSRPSSNSFIHRV